MRYVVPINVQRSDQKRQRIALPMSLKIVMNCGMEY